MQVVLKSVEKIGETSIEKNISFDVEYPETLDEWNRLLLILITTVSKMVDNGGDQ